MRHNPPSDTSAGSRRPASATRRAFLKTSAGVGALAAGVGGGIGTAAAEDGIETPWLHRDGNLVRDPSDNPITLRGINVIDPAAPGGGSVIDYIDNATNGTGGWYARSIRVPIHPGSVGGGGTNDESVPAFDRGQLEQYLDTYVDGAVDHCEEVGAYVILDYHRHWPDGPDWDEPALGDEVDMFWETLAPRYADRSHVIYEVYNEPTTPNSGDPADSTGEQTWLDWRETAQPWVDTIREHAPQNLVLIGSPRWSQFTAQAPSNEFEGDDLAYVGHVYTQDALYPLSTYFGEASEQVPVFITEFGWSPFGDDHWIGTNEVEGQRFKDFFDAYPHVSWNAWSFDAVWGPSMLDSYWQPNDFGEMVRGWLEELKDDRVPGEGGGEDCNGIFVGEGSEYCATDPNGDGKHTDVNGNGGNDFDDVVTFFEEMQSDGVQNNVPAFDFNDNGGIDFDDVVALFERI